MPLTRVSIRNKSELQEHCSWGKNVNFCWKGNIIAIKTVSHSFVLSVISVCRIYTTWFLFTCVLYFSKRAFQAFNLKLLTFDNGNSLMTEQFSIRNQCCIYLIYRNSALTKMYLKGIYVLYMLFVWVIMCRLRQGTHYHHHAPEWDETSGLSDPKTNHWWQLCLPFSELARVQTLPLSFFHSLGEGFIYCSSHFVVQ